ncbi:MAG: chlorite dismutase family protein [Nitrososphaerota archaeon]|nr:chlorite dismutase family protein [Nitrososphaerota archaeon]
MEEQRATEPEKHATAKRYLKYTFFKVDRAWRSLVREEQQVARKEFIEVLMKPRDETGLSYFSLVGLRGDTDFMILADSPTLDSFPSLLSELLSTRLGRYLDTPYSYLAMTRRSPYLGSHKHPGQEGTGADDPRTSSRYLFVYPFIKKREWYKLPFTERQRMMAEHFKIGHKYPRIKINTGYSFGLDDQEFMLGFEGDDPSEFLALVEELRSSEASMYTQLETPIFSCLRVEPERMLDLV